MAITGTNRARCRQLPLVPGNINVGSIPAVRHKLLMREQAGYHLAHTPVVNPGSKPFTLVCGAEASDIATPFYTFNPTKSVFVDKQEMNLRALKYEVARWLMQPFDRTDNFRNARPDRRLRGFIQEERFVKHAEKMMVVELRSLGVERDSVRLKRDASGNVVMSFPWAYPGQMPVERTITFICSDITNPPVWNPTLRALLLSGRVDAYYQKSAVDCMDSMDRYLFAIANWVRGFMVVSAETDNVFDSHIGKNLREMLGRDYDLVPDINDAYEPLFMQKWGRSEYSWRVELFKRKRAIFPSKRGTIS